MGASKRCRPFIIDVRYGRAQILWRIGSPNSASILRSFARSVASEFILELPISLFKPRWYDRRR
jgi:hypothetical protein